MKLSNRAFMMLVLVVLAGVLVAAQMQGCEAMDGGRHALAACPVAILPVALVLGLIALALVAITDPPFRSQLVLIPARHPPRPPRVR